VQSAVLRLHVVRLSVCLPITLVDQNLISWKSWKVILLQGQLSQNQNPLLRQLSLGLFYFLYFKASVNALCLGVFQSSFVPRLFVFWVPVNFLNNIYNGCEFRRESIFCCVYIFASRPGHCATVGLRRWDTSEVCRCRSSSASPVCRYTSTLIVPSTHRSTLGDRAFPVASARAWNALPSPVRAETSLQLFRRDVKTILLCFWHWQRVVILIFTARCTAMQSAVLRLHVVCPSGPSSNQIKSNRVTC